MTAFEELKTQWAEQDIIATPSEGHKAIFKKGEFHKEKTKTNQWNINDYSNYTCSVLHIYSSI
ncbi:hypothetical protein M601_013805 [Cellulophaga baltica 4]|nr:hypothetical protein M601_013805 [Cellulophaga baltica 4]